VAIPVRRNAHHAQLLATPPTRTKLVTKFGVSVLKVVATIDTPMSHHGAARPEVKNSAVLRPARLISMIAGAKEMAIETRTMSQSMALGFMRPAPPRASPPRRARARSCARSLRGGGRVRDRCRGTMDCAP